LTINLDLLLSLIKSACRINHDLLLEGTHRRQMKEVARHEFIPLTRTALHIAPFSARLDENVSVRLHGKFPVAGYGIGIIMNYE